MQAAAAAALQSAWRGHAVRAALDSELTRLAEADGAAVNIQAVWRGRAARDEMLLQHLAATDIQAHWRGKLHRDDVLRHRCPRERGHREAAAVPVARQAIARAVHPLAGAP